MPAWSHSGLIPLTARKPVALTAQGSGISGNPARSPPATPTANVIPWHLVGTTDLDGLRPVCDSCHHDVHLGGRTLTLRDSTAIGPHGWIRRSPRREDQLTA